jgi:hypothetical protein
MLPAGQQMHVRVVETGQSQPAAQIDDPCPRSDPALDVCSGAGGRDPAIEAGDGFDFGTMLVDSPDPAVPQDQVGLRLSVQ